MPPRPTGAPSGMVRAHMATFPPREGIFRRVVDAILPQVDRLFIVFNGYAAVPADIAANPKIEAVVPDTDLRDAGKFAFAPGADDLVFLIDDDLGYPADYVERSLAQADGMGWAGRIFGYLGFVPQINDSRFSWQIHYLRDAKLRAEPAAILGTGAVLARGDSLPPLSEIKPFAGAVDVGMARWAQARGIRLTMLPRTGAWLSNRLPKELASSSIHMTDSRNPRPIVLSALSDLARAAMADPAFQTDPAGVKSGAPATGA